MVCRCTLEAVPSVSEIPAEDWDACANPASAVDSLDRLDTLASPSAATGSPPTETGYQFSGNLGTFQPNTTYTLTVGLSHSYDWNPSDAMKAGIGFATGTTAGTVVASQLYSMRNDGTSGDLVTYNQFTDKTFTLTTGPADAIIGQPLRVALVFEHAGQYFRGARFDNVRLDATVVPEPTMVGVLAAGSILALRRRRFGR